MSQLVKDFSGALRKTQVLARVPKATKYQAMSWGTDTIRLLRRSAADMQKSGRGKKTGQLARNTGMEVAADPAGYRILIGTGVGKTQSVKYAKIQDEGGTTHPRVTDKMRRWAWAMHYKMFGREVRGMGLKGRERKGALATWNATNFYKAIALTKKTVLEVKIPASNWFSRIIAERKPVLAEMMKPATVLQVAEGMIGGGK